MNKKVENIKNYRLYLLRQLDGLTVGQLNHIPAGYNNNIIWNLAHLICAQQNMCYIRAGLPVLIDDRYFTPYVSGTKPEKFVDEPEINIIKGLLISSIDILQSDLDKNLFENYSPSVMIPKVYGIEVNTIDDAIDYLLYHEGFHGGYILSMKHLAGSS